MRHDAQTHMMEMRFLELQNHLENAKTAVGLANLQIAELTKDYAKHTKVSQDEATLTLIRLAKLVRTSGPNI